MDFVSDNTTQYTYRSDNGSHRHNKRGRLFRVFYVLTKMFFMSDVCSIALLLYLDEQLNNNLQFIL